MPAGLLQMQYDHVFSVFIKKTKQPLEKHLEPCKASKMEHLAKIVNGFQLLTTFAKRSFLDF